MTETLAAETATANDAEISLLGAAMIGANIHDLAELVRAGDFYDVRRGAAWSAILRVHAKGTPPDVVTVRAEMEAAGDKCDPVELFRWTELTPGPAAAPHYAQQVADASGRRALIAAGIRITNLGRGAGELAADRELARQSLDEACARNQVSRARHLADVLPAVIDIAENGQPDTLSTPWADVDYFIGGLAPGRMIVVSGLPGGGKSLMGTNLALHVAARHGHAALIASMEMPEVEVGQRLLAAYANVNLKHLVNGTVTEDEWSKVARQHAEMAELPIVIDDTPHQTVQHIRGRARDVQRDRDDLALIVVDYLQLMDTTGGENRSQALAATSRELKLMARETGACVVVLAQLNREGKKRDRPTMSDLAESGATENDADQILLLHRPDREVPEVDVIVDKNRHGATGTRTLHLWGHYAKLASATGRWSA